ncbi:MAG: four helix bundle protein [Phycisphaeraceae bacterium]|nr:MAG: four helix bundle protein [Phycisphaeraceae bacterium]
MAIERFEDILAWRKARTLTREVYRVTRMTPCDRDFRYCNQIQSASVSIMSNIAEGFERRTPRHFANYLSISKASCAEVRSLLYVGLDVGYIDRTTFDSLMNATDEIGRMLTGFRRTLDQSRPGAEPRNIENPPPISDTNHSELGTQNSELKAQNSEINRRNTGVLRG